MNGKCLELGTIQAFLDGEIGPEISIKVADHVAQCDRCAQLLTVAEEESSFVFSALEREMNTLVPTQRIWSRINESIAVEKSHRPAWSRLLAFVSLPLASPSFAAAASVVIVLGLFAILWQPQVERVEREVSGVSQQPGQPPFGVQGGMPVNPESTNPEPIMPVTAEARPASDEPVQVKHFKRSNLPAAELTKLVRTSDDQPQPQYAVYRYLPGEESYVKTIADLKESLEEQREAVFTPSTRIAFERDMAVVDDSIRKLRDVVRKNPRNQAARQVLYSSYQDKIDLLNSVAQREELMASIR